MLSSSHEDLEFTLPAMDGIPDGEPMLLTVEEPRDRTDRHRLAMRRATVHPGNVHYVIVIGASNVIVHGAKQSPVLASMTA